MISDDTPLLRFDELIDAAAANEWAAVDALLAGITDSEFREDVRCAIWRVYQAGALAAFRAGWNAHADPAPWILGCIENTI